MKIILKSQQLETLGETYEVNVSPENILIEIFSGEDLWQIVKLPLDVFNAINTNLKIKEL